MHRPIKTAVFPVAGLGTRFLPATKAMPKEMLTIVDRPVIQLAVDEAREAGIEHFIFVTGRNKAVIEDHFDKQYELEDTLRNSDSRSAGVAEAEANLLAAQADRNQAQRTLARYQAASSAFSRQQIDEAAQVAETTAARVSQAQAALERAQAEQRPDANDQDPLVIAKRAELAQAQYDLENTIIRAPTDGYLTQLAVRPGMMAVPLPLKPMGVFVHDEPGRFTGAFRQQALNRIQQGDEAELTFTALPGQVFSAEVIEVLPAIAESQVAAGDHLLGADAFKTVDAPALVTLRLLPDQDVPDLPLGISAQAPVIAVNTWVSCSSSIISFPASPPGKMWRQ